jgi:hypothetical protein
VVTERAPLIPPNLTECPSCSSCVREAPSWLPNFVVTNFVAFAIFVP